MYEKFAEYVKNNKWKVAVAVAAVVAVAVLAYNGVDTSWIVE